METLPKDIIFEIALLVPFNEWKTLRLISNEFRKLISNVEINSRIKQMLWDQELLESEFIVSKLNTLKLMSQLIAEFKMKSFEFSSLFRLQKSEISEISHGKIFNFFNKNSIEELHPSSVLFYHDHRYFKLIYNVETIVFTVVLDHPYPMKIQLTEKYVHLYNQDCSYSILISELLRTKPKEIFFNPPGSVRLQQNYSKVLFCPKYDNLAFLKFNQNTKSDYKYAVYKRLGDLEEDLIVGFPTGSHFDLVWNGYPFIILFSETKLSCIKILENGDFETTMEHDLKKNYEAQVKQDFPKFYFFKNSCVIHMRKTQQIFMITQTEFIGKDYYEGETIQSSPFGIHWIEQKSNKISLFTFDIKTNSFRHFSKKIDPKYNFEILLYDTDIKINLFE